MATMSSPIVQATISACVLTAISNIAAQCITAYRHEIPYTVDWLPILQFVIFAALNSPPNFLWQEFLESVFPSYTLQPSASALVAAAAGDDPALDRSQAAHTLLEPRLNVRHTAAKFLLDQSVGAALNTLAFSVAMAAFRGSDAATAIHIARREFWPLMTAGWRLWPAVCLVNFTLVRSVQGRALLGSVAGVVWNVYLSLVAIR